ncbi:MAG: ATP-dependent 6-phosphofructokinase [Myxococcota bacterium]|nr:ATP-dependent 6-phosphofructokinase [Myxococcota bacterium]
MRVGILTGGGDCPGLNAVIRAVVRGLHNEGGAEVETLGFFDGFLGVIADRTCPLGPDAVSGILPRGGTILGSSNRDNPFDFHGVIDGVQVDGDVTERVLDTVERNSLDALVVIGGDGTLSIADRFAGLGVPLVGVPKTIDNDLAATDRTFGFDTAVGICSEAIDRIHTTAESHHRVMFVEVMGRHAGHIALHAGTASGGDVILIPEIPFTVESICEAVEARRGRGKHFSIVVVSEGAAPLGGGQVFYRTVETGAEKGRLGGVSNQVAAEVEQRVGLETRTTILGHVQRGGSPSAFDRVLATRFGVCAARQVLSGNFRTMASLRGPTVRPVPLAEAVAEPARVDPQGELVSVARASGISFGDGSV